jgi:hypothetical protein
MSLLNNNTSSSLKRIFVHNEKFFVSQDEPDADDPEPETLNFYTLPLKVNQSPDFRISISSEYGYIVKTYLHKEYSVIQTSSHIMVYNVEKKTSPFCIYDIQRLQDIRMYPIYVGITRNKIIIILQSRYPNNVLISDLVESKTPLPVYKGPAFGFPLFKAITDIFIFKTDKVLKNYDLAPDYITADELKKVTSMQSENAEYFMYDNLLYKQTTTIEEQEMVFAIYEIDFETLQIKQLISHKGKFYECHDNNTLVVRIAPHFIRYAPHEWESATPTASRDDVYEKPISSLLTSETKPYIPLYSLKIEDEEQAGKMLLHLKQSDILGWRSRFSFDERKPNIINLLVNHSLKHVLLHKTTNGIIQVLGATLESLGTMYIVFNATKNTILKFAIFHYNFNIKINERFAVTNTDFVFLDESSKRIMFSPLYNPHEILKHRKQIGQFRAEGMILKLKQCSL